VRRLEWNALRVRDKVLVHDPLDPLVLQPGIVALVETARGRANEIAVRVAASDGTKVVRPLRLTVHLDPGDGDEACWRCDERATTDAGV